MTKDKEYHPIDSELPLVFPKIAPKHPLMDITHLLPGCQYLRSGDQALIAGCPPETVKVIRQIDLKSPKYVLLPDIPVAAGESQVSVEFLLYQHLFFSGNKNAGKLVLIGSKRRSQAAKDLLDLTLFGPEEEQMRKWGMEDEEAARISKETRWFHMKDKEGKSIPIEGMVEIHELEDEELDLDWIKIRRIEPNVFRIKCGRKTGEIDLNFSEEQAPPYPVTTDLTVSNLVKMGIEVLGGATGFSTAQASSGMAVCYNGNYTLIDAIPYLNYHLRARGIARNQIHSLILTHIHDDHCNVIPLLQYNRKIQILTTPLIYQMLLKKLELTMDRPVDRLKQYFTFLPLTPGEETDFFGLRIMPHWSSHSIPTMGFTLTTEHGGRDYTMAYTGDNQSLSDLKKMQKAGVVDAERFAQIAELYQKRYDLLIADGGEGILHGDPSDALGSDSDRIVFLHLDKLSDRFHAQFTVATSGKRFPIQNGDTDYNLTRTIEFLMEYFPEMPPIWISNLLANQKTFSYNAGDIIIRQGTRSEGHVYMILTGYAQVIQHTGEKSITLAQMEAGELIGEMSIITGKGQRNASVVALSPVTVTAFSEASFHGYIRHQNYEAKLRGMWQSRELLQTLPYLRSLQQPVIRALSERVHLSSIPERTHNETITNICEEGGLLFPLELELDVEISGKKQTLPKNGAPIFCRPGDKLLTEAEFQYLMLRPHDAAKLRSFIPAFRYFWEQILDLPVPPGG